MKYCANCGKGLEDNAFFCDSCGHQFTNNQQPSFQQQQQIMFGQNVPQNKKNHTSLILGIVGIVFAWLFAIVGHALSIVGIILGIKEYKENNNISGLAVSIVGELCAILSSIIGAVTMASLF